MSVLSEVTASSRHYVDRLFDLDPQKVLQGVIPFKATHLTGQVLLKSAEEKKVEKNHRADLVVDGCDAVQLKI